MADRIFQPKELVNAFFDHTNVNLRHLKTRLDLGYVEPLKKSEGKGKKTLYNLPGALCYGASILLEDMGFSIEDAAVMAKYMITTKFEYRNSGVWIIELGYGLDKIIKFTTHECVDRSIPFYLETEEKRKKYQESYIYTEPWKDIIFKFHKNVLINVENTYKGKPKYIYYYNVSDVIKECCERFSLSENEIQFMDNLSKQNKMAAMNKQK